MTILRPSGPVRRTIAMVLLCVVGVGCSSTERGVSDVPSSRPPSTLVLLGDSLAEQAAPMLGVIRPELPQVRRWFGGTAPCDWLDRDLDADRRSIVVVQFTGNSLTPCMSDGAGGHLAGQAIIDAYHRDVPVLVQHARNAGAWVLLVGQPHRAPSFGDDAVVDGLNDLYRSLAASDRYVAFVDAGASVESPDGSYTDRLPCESFDQQCDADGTTVVRGDGVHFCPVPNTVPCPVWSGGAFRFAGAIAAAVDDPASYD